MPISAIGGMIGPISGFEAILIAAVAILSFMVWALTRHQECRYAGEPPGTITEMLPAVAGSTHSLPISGNHITLVRDAEFFDCLEAAFGEARSSVHLETYLWADGEASDRVVDALVGAARRGLAVRVLADARGAGSLGKASRRRLRQAGCHFSLFHRWQPKNLGRFNVRDHRKIIVVDGRTAVLGGHCITDHWLHGKGNKPPRRDISARITGPVVANIQSAFLDNWQEATGELLVDDATFPRLGEEGAITTHLAYVRPDGCPSAVQALHYLAIAFAKKRIRIQNPYFLPDRAGAKALGRAARRGVDVRIMTPAVDVSDSPYVQRASHFLYRGMLEAGVRIFEHHHTLIHQKTITVDGEWCALGSSNFDDRSFEINDEVTLGIADTATAGELDAAFDRDLGGCRERTLEEWEKRPAWKRAVDGFHYLFNEQL